MNPPRIIGGHPTKIDPKNSHKNQKYSIIKTPMIIVIGSVVSPNKLHTSTIMKIDKSNSLNMYINYPPLSL